MGVARTSSSELLIFISFSCRCRWQWYVALVVLLVSSGLLTGDVGAEERTQPIKIGVLTASWGPTPQTVGLRDGLLELGYKKDEQFVLGVRFTQGNLTALPAAARELVQYGVDIIFASEEGPAKAAQMATSRIPIVFAGASDPVGLGLVQSFAHPGSNIMGVTGLYLELSPKRLELFHEIIPSLKRVLFLYDAADAAAVAEAKVYRDAAHRLGMVLVEQAVRTEAEAQATLAQTSKGEVDGILVTRQASFNIPGFVLEAASQQAIPTMVDAPFWVERGGLAGYGPDMYASGRQAARLVDKILKGVKPAEIPVEVTPKVEFVINLKVAKALGLTVAPEVLYRADRIIR
jgi:putative tryptophan/tyrosine transport system substrate-binding protein